MYFPKINFGGKTFRYFISVIYPAAQWLCAKHALHVEELCLELISKGPGSHIRNREEVSTNTNLQVSPAYRGLSSIARIKYSQVICFKPEPMFGVLMSRVFGLHWYFLQDCKLHHLETTSRDFELDVRIGAWSLAIGAFRFGGIHIFLNLDEQDELMMRYFISPLLDVRFLNRKH